MQKNAYDIEFEVESVHWWFAVRRSLLKKLLASLPLSSKDLVLDIGCGVGSNLRALESAGFHVIGLDRSIYALHLARKGVESSLVNGDLNKLPIRSQSLGVIIAMDVLEHLEDDANGMQELYRTLKKDGILVLTVPAFDFLWGTQDVVTGHKRRYSLSEITNKLKEVGFEILKRSYFNFFLFLPILMVRRLIHILTIKVNSENKINCPFINFFLKVFFSIEIYFLRYFPFPFGVSIFCIAKKN